MGMTQHASMAMTITLSVGLRAWISDNLARGAPTGAMVDVLVGKNFEPSVARALIEAFAAARAAGRPAPAHSVQLDLPTERPVAEPPRIALGHRIAAGDRTVRVLSRLRSPTVATLEGVMDDRECARLIELAEARLRRSTVIDGPTGADVEVDRRSSHGMFFRLREDPFIAILDERLSAIMNLPPEHSEGLQVLRYRPGGQYPPHFDFLEPSNPASAQSIARSGQRVSTLIVYLNDVLAGGETVFPEIGFSVVPRRGSGLYFEYTDSRMRVDARSAHGGAPVIEGEKWIVTKWMRSRPFVPEADPKGGSAAGPAAA